MGQGRDDCQGVCVCCVWGRGVGKARGKGTQIHVRTAQHDNACGTVTRGHVVCQVCSARAYHDACCEHGRSELRAGLRCTYHVFLSVFLSTYFCPAS